MKTNYTSPSPLLMVATCGIIAIIFLLNRLIVAAKEAPAHADYMVLEYGNLMAYVRVEEGIDRFLLEIEQR